MYKLYTIEVYSNVKQNIIIFFELFESLYVFVLTDLPKTELTVDPKSPVFTGETVTLTCVIESHSYWRYEWYKDRYSVMLQSSDRYTVNRDTLTIRGATESDQGQYWCRGQIRSVSSQSRSTVSLSVKGELNIIFLINSLYYMSGQYECHTFEHLISLLTCSNLNLMTQRQMLKCRNKT